MKIENCIGCSALSSEGRCIWYSKDLDCPCANCLIKMMCCRICDSFKDYAKQYNACDRILNDG